MGEWVSADEFIREYNESIPNYVEHWDGPVTPRSQLHNPCPYTDGNSKKATPNLDDYDWSPDSKWDDMYGHKYGEDDDEK